MKYNLSVLLIALSICTMMHSCKIKSSDVFFAGKTENVYYLKFNPELSLPQGNNKDSIDLYGDLKYELMFETFGVAGETGFFTLPAVRGTKDLNILLDCEKNMPKALSKGQIISIYDNWSSTDSLLALYYYPSLHSDPIGYWKDQTNKYLGFKYKNKLGWIMITTTVNAQLNQCLIIKELGIEN
jgi:hypothetical protein